MQRIVVLIFFAFCVVLNSSPGRSAPAAESCSAPIRSDSNQTSVYSVSVGQAVQINTSRSSAFESLPLEKCQKYGLAVLKRQSPSSFENFISLDDKSLFTKYLDCSNQHKSLVTAVHESTHLIDRAQLAYSTSSHGALKYAENAGDFFEPRKMTPQLDPCDPYVNAYLVSDRTATTTQISFVYLLDELNAYTRGLEAGSRLRMLLADDQVVGDRDGLAASMLFVNTYVTWAKEHEPQTWQRLHDPTVSALLEQLWANANAAMETACPYANLGFNDKKYLGALYRQSETTETLEELLGHKIKAPLGCSYR